MKRLKYFTIAIIFILIVCCDNGNNDTSYSYTITYDANGGNGTMWNSTHIIGTTKNLNINTFTRNSYDFMGWATSSTGNVTYTDGQSVTNLTTKAGDTVILYAVWNIISIVPGSGLAEKLTWLQTNAQSDINYTLEVNADEGISPANLSYNGKTNIGIILKSIDIEYFIYLSSNGLSINGSLFTVGDGVTLNLGNNIILQGNDSNNASLVHVNEGGTLVMNIGSYIRDNSARKAYDSAPGSRGGGVYVDSNGAFIMNGGKISGNSTYSGYNNSPGIGGGVYVNYGTFTMNGGEISGNSALRAYPAAPGSEGGGVYMNGGTFTMNGGKISGNSATSGSGVYIDKPGVFTMQGGKITNNSGRGVSVDNGGVFTMYDGEISYNPDGGVTVDVDYDGTFTMNGGKIFYNSATSFGGGVCVTGYWGYYKGTFTMNGGEISNNTATSGGGVYVDSNGTFIMNNGEISSNSATSGGGVYVSKIFTMNGGKISGNTATSGGGVYADSGGVYAEKYGVFTMQGGEIFGNTATSNGGGVYVPNSYNSGIFRIVTGTIYGSDESVLSFKNNASTGAALYQYSSRRTEYGTFNSSTWNKNGELATTDNTIRVVNGVLQ